ncbi:MULTISPECIES: hypothetical protein, partial [[Limnothrix rosea] IAM M-220]|uniref:hypothetical protein n=1 Tax=[Limnothrix rosea] IAM M-220 TaxID=454133 RepID=UPI00095945FC
MSKYNRKKQCKLLFAQILNSPQKVIEVLINYQKLFDRNFFLFTVSLVINKVKVKFRDIAKILVGLIRCIIAKLSLCFFRQTSIETNEDDRNEYIQFMEELSQAALQNYAQRSVTFPILMKYEHLLNRNFGYLLCDWLLTEYQLHPKYQEELIGLLTNLLLDIQQFPRGRRWENIEIVIQGSKYRTKVEQGRIEDKEKR